MDDKDRLLLSLLRRDARRPIVALARDLGLSRTATQDRLARLQSSGAIAGFTIVDRVAPEAAYLTIRLAPGGHCRQIMPKLKQVPTVELAHSVTGQVDLIVRVAADTMAAIEAARTAIAAIPGVADVSTHVVLERHLG
jgi:Lrp/AsnC family transcriptional regulator, leucine-responsive regulatory protein